MEYAMNEYQPKLTLDLLDYLLFKQPGKKGSGMIHLYPCDCTGYSIRPFIRKRVLDCKRLVGLMKLNFTIKDTDVVLAMEDIHNPDIEYWRKLIEFRYSSTILVYMYMSL